MPNKNPIAYPTPPRLDEIMPASEVSGFRAAVARHLAAAGLDLTRLTSRHSELLNAKDVATSLRAVQLGYQLHGMNAEESQQSGDINIQVNIVQNNLTNGGGGESGTPANRG